MKLYNRQLQEISNPERENRIQKLCEKIIEYISENYEVDKNNLQEKIKKLSVVEREHGKSSFVEYNGKKEEIAKNSNAASFVIHKNQEKIQDKWNFENAVYTSDSNSDHTITHELVHYFSYNTEMIFNENGIAYDKVGTKIIGYDKEDEEVDLSLNGSGLNEGITELLANRIDKNSPTVYAYQVCIADILVNKQDNSLVKAFFSNDEKDFRDFLEDFDKRQLSVSSKDLLLVKPNSNFDNFDKNIFKGCIEYSLSFCNSIENFNQEKTRLEPIIKNISIFNYKDSKETEKFLSDILTKKQAEILSLKQDNKQTGKSDNPKMKFIKGFIQAYDDTEDEYQYAKRANDDLMDIERLQKILETNGMNKMLLADLDGRLIKGLDNDDFKVQYSQKQVSAMARLLKVAQLLTESKKLNPEGRNYLEEFTNLPDIENKLKQMKEDFKDENSYMYDLRQRARENRANGNIPKYPETNAEKEAKENKSSREQGLKQEIGISQAEQEKIERNKEIIQKDEKRHQQEKSFQKQENKKLEQEQNFSKNRGLFGKVIDDAEQSKEDRRCNINTFRDIIEKGKISRSERDEQTKSIAEIQKVNSLIKRKERGENLSNDQENLVNEHIRRTNAAQVEYQKQQSLTRKVKNNGIGMGR